MRNLASKFSRPDRHRLMVNRRTFISGLVASTGQLALPARQATAAAHVPLTTEAPSIVVRTTENIPEGGWVWLLNTARESGIHRIYLLIKQDENNYESSSTARLLKSGELLVPLDGHGTAEGWEDPAWLDEMLKKAASFDIQIHAWWPLFQDAIAAAKFPHARYAGNNHDVFVDPAYDEVRAFQARQLRALLKRYPFDGVALDWIRYNSRPDGANGPLGERFALLTGMQWTADAMADPMARAVWDDLRAREIAAWVKDLLADIRPVHPEVAWSAFVLPWMFKEVGQSYRHLSAAGLDALQPMIYWKDWKENADLTSDVISPAPFYLTGRTTLDPTFDVTGSESEITTALDYLPHDRLGSVTWYKHAEWTSQDFDRVAAFYTAWQASRAELYNGAPPPVARIPIGQRLEPAAFHPDASVWLIVCLAELNRRKALQFSEPVIPVLGLHRFTQGGLGSGDSVWHTSTAYLDRLFAFLNANEFTTIAAPTLAAFMTSEDETLLPQRPIALTIDDGSASVATLFEPLAAKANITYTAAIVTNWVEGTEGRVIDVGEGLTDTILTWADIRALSGTGRVGFVSHTHAQHRYANGGRTGTESGPAITTRLWIDEEKREETDTERQRRVYDDLATSRKLLGRQLDQPVTMLAWPYGLHDDKAEAAALEAGFTHFLEFGNGTLAAPRKHPNRIMRLSVMQMDEEIPLAFPQDAVMQQRWWLSFLRWARLSKSSDLIDATLAQLDADQESHPEAEISRAARLVLNGHSTLAARSMTSLRQLYSHDTAVHSSIDDFEAAYKEFA